jgi:hypothetical protein
MTMKYLAENVRIAYAGSPFEVAHDVVVEVLVNGQWTKHAGYNSLSNDYAHSSANEAAIRYMRLNPIRNPERVHNFGKLVNGEMIIREYQTSISDGATLFPQQAYVAYEKGACGDDPHAYGATPEEAVANLREMIED